MAVEKTYRRLPLRDLITDADKRAHGAVDHINSTWIARAADLRDLSRPVRRKSNYPTLLALQNALKRFVELSRETDEMLDHLEHQVVEIREHARRERLNRS